MGPYEPVSGLDWRGSTYIGDGVYAMADRSKGVPFLWLRTDRDNGPHVIAFEPCEWTALARFAEEVFADRSNENKDKQKTLLLEHLKEKTEPIDPDWLVTEVATKHEMDGLEVSRALSSLLQQGRVRRDEKNRLSL